MIEMGTKAMDQANMLRENLMTAGRQMWLASLGAMAMVEEKGRGAFDMLVEKGKTKDTENTMVAKVINQATEQVTVLTKKVETTVQETGQAVMHRIGMPTHDEIQMLITRVEALTRKVESMKG